MGVAREHGTRVGEELHGGGLPGALPPRPGGQAVPVELQGETCRRLAKIAQASQPVTPCSTTSSGPVTGYAATGVPQAMASSITTQTEGVRATRERP
jgi:hypothetical protein